MRSFSSLCRSASKVCLRAVTSSEINRQAAARRRIQAGFKPTAELRVVRFEGDDAFFPRGSPQALLSGGSDSGGEDVPIVFPDQSDLDIASSFSAAALT